MRFKVQIEKLKDQDLDRYFNFLMDLLTDGPATEDFRNGILDQVVRVQLEQAARLEKSPQDGYC